jgi:hypothetical protein
MTSVDPNEEPITPRTVRRLFLLGALPFVGFVLFVLGAVLSFSAFSDNNSLNCSQFGGFGSVPGCHHHSYVLPILLIAGGIAVSLGGGMIASYYAARRMGLPLVNAVMRRIRVQQDAGPPEPPLIPPAGA